MRTSKSIGNSWEQLVIQRGKYLDVTVKKIEDGCKATFNGNIQRVKQIFDFIGFHDRRTAFFDAKTYNEDRISYSTIRTKTNEHQVDHLLDIMNQGLPAGFLVCFRPVDKVVFFNADLLDGVAPGESLSWTKGTQLGGLFDFDLRKIFDAPKRRTLKLVPKL